MNDWLETLAPLADDAQQAVAYLMMTLLTVALLLAFYRLLRGPSLADRVVALDVSATLIVGIIGLYAIAESEPLLLRVAMVIALVSFVGSVAFAYYIQTRGAS